MTLTCETEATSQQLDDQLQFCFFRDDQALDMGCGSDPVLQVPTVWRKDSGSYWCEAKTSAQKVTRSPRIQIQVQGERGGPVLGADSGGAWVCSSLQKEKLLEVCQSLSFSPYQSP